MSEAIITVENLGKKYSLRHLRDQRYVALRDVLVEKATGLFLRNGRRRDNETTRPQDNKTVVSSQSSDGPGPVVSGQWSGGPSKEDFWALRNVSFEVRRG